MDDVSRMSDMDGDFDALKEIKSPLTKTRSLSDGGTPKLNPSPHIFEAKRHQSKDDIGIRDKDVEPLSQPQPVLPSTPIRAGFPIRGLSLQMPQQSQAAQPASYVQPAPLSPKLDHSNIYASPTNILPRRSRGLDFSRAATSLHHSTLADQATPDSSPTIGSRAMNIPGRRNDFGPSEQTSSLWSVMGNDRMHVSSSLGSNTHILSDSSSSSDDDDFMDEDMEDNFVTTPQVAKPSMPISGLGGTPWMPGGGGSPSVNSMLSFQQRQRVRKQSRKKPRGPLGLGFHASAIASGLSKSPPANMSREMSSPHNRRESISWAANQLHISGNESDDNAARTADASESPSRPGVIRRAVTRRGNLLVRKLLDLSR